ncbi:MAG: trypsin-like serine protease, partial [Desulfobacterales bacterium]|nr:trypsin-like serine protease [Desulfobacterales bacterium]
QRFNVENIFTHPLYIPFSEFPENDIALLELEPSSLDLESTIDPVSDDMSLEGLDGIILGWGNTVPNVSSKSPVLQQANVPIVSNSDCEFAYYDYSPNPIADTMVCAGDYVNGEVDTCQGDSGGPLLIDEGEGNIKLAGVTSWGIGCAQPGFYGVYTRVSEFLDFIGQNFIIAKAGPDQTVRNGSVTLNAGQSHIPEGATAEYEWKLQSRTCIAATCDATANGEITTVANLKNGIYDVTLTVTDGELTDTDVMVVNSCFIMSAIY